MTKLQRIANAALGLLMIACGLILLLRPHDGLIFVAYVLSFMLVLYGVRKLVYYVRMARHMTGGLTVLFIAVIALDVGVFAVTIIDNPKLAIALYLICYSTVAGILSIARGIESKLFGSPWILNIVIGLVNLSLASLCASSVNSDETIIWLFCLGLFYCAGERLVSAFKPTEIVYIQ